MVRTRSLLIPLLIAATEKAGAFHPSAPSPFVASKRHATRRQAPWSLSAGKNGNDQDEKMKSDSAPFAVKSSELDVDLSEEEKTTINVFRTCGPSVAYVTSVMNRREDPRRSSTRRSSTRRSRKGRRGGSSSIFGRRNGGSSTNEKESDSSEDEPKQQRRQRGEENVRPEGSSLGSGSGFVVSEDGYLVTNYHVIQRAYQMNTAVERYNDEVDALVTNATKFLFGPLGDAVGDNEFVDALANRTKRSLRFEEEGDEDGEEPLPRASVYVRINSSTKYRECEVVGVRPDLDVAVLKIIPRANSNGGNSGDAESFPPIPYGPSSTLLVGQKLIAIGNPFGLDQTVTSGVVSALNREMQSVSGRPIRGVIQTDAAINPGNSGGPLLDTKGRLVGINTAIITTSGSNAGIGFAVPSDRVQAAVDEIIVQDRAKSYPERPKPGTMGADLAGAELSNALSKKYFSDKDLSEVGLFVTKVKEGSPAMEAGMKPLVLDQATGAVTLGDRIVAVGGTSVSTKEALVGCMKGRVEGEKVAVTVEDPSGERRVIYVTLAKKTF